MIVLNTLNLAVTEYDWSFQSITPTHAGSATGLFELGGDLDGLATIVSEITTAKPLWDDSLKSLVKMVYFSVTGEGDGELIVQGKTDEWRYDFALQESGTSRCKPGLGIRENYLAFGFSKPDGAAFTLDRIEVLDAKSATRRV